MDFTPLHRELGEQPGPLTDAMLDSAVAHGLPEADDLDWKRDLPPEKSLAQSDTVKDIAALANSGGGLIVYGFSEKQSRATGRLDVGEVSEGYERTLRKVAVSGIHPPVFGLGVHRLGPEGQRALAVVVPASSDVPHLIYRGEYFGAPVRNHADTEWMRERHLEALYRLRLDDRLRSAQALESLYTEVLAGRPVEERAWIIGVARPRLTRPTPRMSREDARKVFAAAEPLMLDYAPNTGLHPWESIDRNNPRPGLRRWVAPNTATSDVSRWKEAWASVHDDGSVTLASSMGGGRGPAGHLPGGLVDSARAERFVADLMGLLRASSNHYSLGEYEVRVGIEWTGQAPLTIQTVDQFGFVYEDASIPLSQFSPVTMSVRTDIDEYGFLDQVRDLATDVINQGGVQNIRAIRATPDK